MKYKITKKQVLETWAKAKPKIQKTWKKTKPKLRKVRKFSAERGRRINRDLGRPMIISRKTTGI